MKKKFENNSGLFILAAPFIFLGFLLWLLINSENQFEATHTRVCEEYVTGIAFGDSKVIVYNLSDGTRDMSQKILNNGDCFKYGWK